MTKKSLITYALDLVGIILIVTGLYTMVSGFAELANSRVEDRDFKMAAIVKESVLWLGMGFIIILLASFSGIFTRK